MLALNSALAFFVNLTNFLVTKTTSALTLQVLPCLHCSGIICLLACWISHVVVDEAATACTGLGSVP